MTKVFFVFSMLCYISLAHVVQCGFIDRTAPQPQDLQDQLEAATKVLCFYHSKENWKRRYSKTIHKLLAEFCDLIVK